MDCIRICLIRRSIQYLLIQDAAPLGPNQHYTRIKRYVDVFKISLREDEITGGDLQYVEKADIKAWGIKNFGDRQKLYGFINELINDD